MVRRSSVRARGLAGVVIVPLVAVLAACGGDDGEGGGDADLTVYSGRTEDLVAPLIEQFEEETGISVEVRYGNTAEMATQILDEGDNSPADVFLAQDAGALGALSEAGTFAELPAELLDPVAAEYRSADGDWVGVSGRSRVVAYNTEAVAENELPSAIADFADPAWAGRVGWAPSNASFQAFVTALRVLEGEEAARSWLTAMLDNGTHSYDNNIAIIEALAAGEIDAGLVNHYYLYPRLEEQPDLPVANKFYSGGDPGALVNVAGVGILGSTDNTEDAEAFVEYLLGEHAQTYFATETWEFPLVAGIAPPEGLPALDSLTPPSIDLAQLEDLQGTLEMLQETGVL
jgi:iron(III) transport system substrate-binding protein